MIHSNPTVRVTDQEGGKKSLIPVASVTSITRNEAR